MLKIYGSFQCMTLVEYYFEQQSLYEDKYGPNTIVLLMKGSFYESYATDTNGKAATVARLLNTVLTKENKNISDVNLQNPYMTGFPAGAISKYLRVLVRNHFTVILIDQKPGDPSCRSVARICSPGTYSDETQNEESNFVCGMYAEYSGTYLIGLTFIDVTTGECHIHEVTSNISSTRLEELYRIIETYNPSEVVCSFGFCGSAHKEEITQCITAQGRMVHCELVGESSEFFDVTYQNTTLDKVFSCDSVLTPIEYLNLELANFGRISLMALLQFCYEHDKTHVQNILIPTIHHDQQQLILHNNALYQLGVVSKNPDDKSLFDVVNHTSTALGKRLLRQQLLKPSYLSSTLNQMYDDTEELMPRIDYYDAKLRHVADIERLHRKMNNRTLHPHELVILCTSYTNIHLLLQAQKHKLLDPFSVFQSKLHETFEVSVCNVSMHDITSSLFTNSHPNTIKLSSITSQISECLQSIDKICKKFSSKLPKDATVKTEGSSKSGYFICTTSNRGSVIKNALGTKASEYTFKNDKKRCIITNSIIESIFHRLITLQEKIKPIATSLYIDSVHEMYNTNKDLLLQIHSFVAEIDVAKSRAKTAVTYGYTRPYIVDGDSESWVSATKLKHAIIDQLPTQSTSFIPNDVALDNENSGVLLYGVNGAGKSCYAKSIGLAIVLAQSGHFVPAECMKFSPFSHLYTRISDQDNIYKGQSSFFVEMSELKSIVHYANERSIVLGDEVCKGTEDISALAIVATSLRWLLDRKSKFVFATHLHRLPKLSVLKSEPRLRIKHMSVDCNSVDNVITFTRELKDGVGDTLYGIEIANFVIQNKEFNHTARAIRKEVLQKHTKLTTPKRSRYNASVVMDTCQIPGCKSSDDLEAHHIIFQSKAGSDTNVHAASNLVVLCHEHHNAVHHGKLRIHGWASTSRGRVLEYSM